MSVSVPAIFVADSPGLDFLNSIATPADTPVDWIGNGAGLVAWLRQGQLVRAQTLDEIEQNASAKSLDIVAARARELREWLRRLVMKYKGRPLAIHNPGEVEPLNALLRQDQSYYQLIVDKNGVHLDSQHRWDSADSLLIPIAEAIARLISDEDFTHIKACEGHACTLIFADHTRARGRRWCSMGICGNRAKVSAHRKRQRAAQ
jgi:predicted RNA-binding Zn ribbon-like protein